MDKIKVVKNEENDKFKDFKKILDKQEAVVEKARAEKEEQMKAMGLGTDKADEIEAKIQVIKEELNQVYEKKMQAREEHFQLKLDYEAELDVLKHLDWMTNQIDRL